MRDNLRTLVSLSSTDNDGARLLVWQQRSGFAAHRRPPRHHRITSAVGRSQPRLRQTRGVLCAAQKILTSDGVRRRTCAFACEAQRLAGMLSVAQQAPCWPRSISRAASLSSTSWATAIAAHAPTINWAAPTLTRSPNAQQSTWARRSHVPRSRRAS